MALVLLFVFAAGTSEAEETYETLAHENEWMTAQLDVWIVPPVEASTLDGLSGGSDPYLDAVEQSIEAWRTGVAEFMADSRIRDALRIRSYVVGRDVIPADAAPEILIAFDRNGLRGESIARAVDLEVFSCCLPRVVDGCLIAVSMTIADPATGRVVDVSVPDTYNLVVHELGHCLGTDHILRGPLDDVMSTPYDHEIGHDDTHLHCVSNLNVMAVEKALGNIVGAPSGGAVTIAASDYRRTAC